MSADEQIELKVGLVLATYGSPMTATTVANLVGIDARDALGAIRRLMGRGYALVERRPHRGERRAYWVPGVPYEELYEEVHPGHPCPVRFARLGLLA